jgi:heat shock protein HslJ
MTSLRRPGRTGDVARHHAHCLAAAALLMSLGACAPNPARESTEPLIGVTWELRAIQSMDDAVGTLAIAEPARFTMRLDADGQASFTLDCNRGTGSWRHRPAAEGSGTLSFGQIAATQARCTPPHLGERIVRDLGFVRGYLLKDGRLYLALMTDAAVYEWVAQRP